MGEKPPSIADAFRRAAAGRECPKCRQMVPYSGIRRHDLQCGEPEVVTIDDDEDEIEEVVVKETPKRALFPRKRKSLDVREFVPGTPDDGLPSSSQRTLLSTTKKVKTTLKSPVLLECFADDGFSIQDLALKIHNQVRDKTSRFAVPKLSQSPKKSQSPRKSPKKPAARSPFRTKIIPNLSKKFARPTNSKKTVISPVDSEVSFPDEEEKPIDEDEAERALLEAEPPGIPGNWAVSYVVRNFWNIVQRVLCSDIDRTAAFWDDHLRMIHRMLQLTDAELHIFLRLCLRMRKWLSLEDLAKYDKRGDENIDQLADKLTSAGLIDSADSPSLTLKDVLRKLSRNDLVRLAKTYHVNHKERVKSMIDAITKTAKGKDVFGNDLYDTVLINAKKALGPVYQVREEAVNIVTALMTMYCPSHMDTVQLFEPGQSYLGTTLMFHMLQVTTGEVKYVAPSDLTDVPLYRNYQTVADLFDFITAKSIEAEMANQRQRFKRQPSQSEAEPKSRSIKFADEFVEAGRRAETWIKNLVDEKSEKITTASTLPHHLRRYTHIWTLVRCCSHLIDGYERCNMYDEAVDLTEFLLQTESLKAFCADRRGALYERLSIDLYSHLKEKTRGFDACLRGISDDLVPLKHKLALQDRAQRLGKDNFSPTIILQAPKKITIPGFINHKSLGDTRLNRFYVRDESNPDAPVEFVSVEELALRHFIKKEGFECGVHAEGGVWHTLFGVLCYDIIFDHGVDDVWLSPLQDHPADMNSADFFDRRRLAFQKRFSLLVDTEHASRCELISLMRLNFISNYGKANTQIDWSLFVTFDNFLAFFECFKPEQVYAVVERMATNHRNWRSGFPDLTLWDPATKRLSAIEVKGPNDKLSTKQRLWLDFFAQNGIDAAVCHVYAMKSRKIPATGVPDWTPENGENPNLLPRNDDVDPYYIVAAEIDAEDYIDEETMDSVD